MSVGYIIVPCFAKGKKDVDSKIFIKRRDFGIVISLNKHILYVFPIFFSYFYNSSPRRGDKKYVEVYQKRVRQ